MFLGRTGKKDAVFFGILISIFEFSIHLNLHQQLASNRFSIEKRDKYFPELDAIRGLAFISVFFFHTLHIPATGAWLNELVIYLISHLVLGLDVFFVLSAFLLTWLGLNEYQKKGFFSIKRYFVRRILRIWPLYFLVLFLGFLVFPWIATLAGRTMTLPNPLFYIFFISNFYLADHVFFLRLLWTISVEEQFYFILGISMKFLRHYVRTIILTFILISVAFAFFRILNFKPFYFNTLFYLIDFSLGAVAGLLLVNRNSVITRYFSAMNQFRTIIFYLILPLQLLIFFLFFKRSDGLVQDIFELIGRYCFVFYISMFLLEQLLNPSRCRILGKNKAIIFTGRISYGLYCYHGISIIFLNILLGSHLPGWLLIAVIFGVNYFIATLSYFYYELPFLRLKTAFR